VAMRDPKGEATAGAARQAESGLSRRDLCMELPVRGEQLAVRRSKSEAPAFTGRPL
jgi:hypothetical protein